MTRFGFYLKHALGSMRVQPQRTFFALLCIAVGVAAVVGLQLLGAMIVATLQSNLQIQSRGDMAFTPPSAQQARNEAINAGAVTPGFISIPDSFSAEGQSRIAAWLAERYPGTLTAQQVRITTAGAGETVNQFTLEYAVDPATYPLYGMIRTEQGSVLSEQLASADSVLISRSLANSLKLNVGDPVWVGTKNRAFTVRGILPNTVDSNPLGSISGFVFISQAAGDFQPTNLYYRLNDPSQLKAATAAFRQAFPYLNPSTTLTLAEQNAQTSAGLLQLVNVMGLLSMLIGGIGIANTMQVIIRSRLIEIGVLKTVGIQASQITRMFLFEAALMGILGSIFGVAIGIGLAALMRQVAESMLSQPVTLAIAPSAILNGVIIGLVVTVVFGVLPTYTARAVRPAVVIKPEAQNAPRAGLGARLAAVIVLMLCIIAITTPILGPSAAMVIPIAFILAILVYGLGWLALTLISRLFPTFGQPDLLFVKRSIRASRRREAAALLAFIVGVFTLGLVTILAVGIRTQFTNALVSQTGGNVSILAPAGDDTLTSIDTALSSFDGIDSYSMVTGYTPSLVSLEQNGSVTSAVELRDRVAAINGVANGDAVIATLSNLNGRDVEGAIPDVRLREGRLLNASDVGQPVLMIGNDPVTANANLRVGDRLTFTFTKRAFLNLNSTSITRTFTVVGIYDLPIGRSSPVISQHFAPRSAFDGISPDSVTAVIQMDIDRLPALRDALSTFPDAFVLETKVLSSYIEGILNQFTTLPILIAALTLLVSGVVIANTTALTVMERRRDIAVMRAVGVSRGRILGLLLLQSGILGMVGSLIGVGLALIMLFLIAGQFGQALDQIPWATASGLIILCILISVVAALTSGVRASGGTPVQALRYE